MSTIVREERTGWDIALGAFLVLAGFVVLGHTIIATAVSVLFVGWTTLLMGVVAVVVTLFRIGKDGFWTGIIGGGLLAAIGFAMVRNPGVAALTLTLVAGSLFFSTGIVRLVAAFGTGEGRVALLLSGGVSTLLGLSVLFNLFSSTFAFLGVLLGVQAIVEGISVMVAGRRRIVPAGRHDASRATA
ncbi:DUF308 domain-containing protein [Phycicoccus endophyticus]|uniref:DUF308 domain-containing protein n=1 Tax=Phycicoccus endophyticus TaxID=1690220 RepID=A0A7G9R1Z0_9MICO|nr:DUF308 domain-containing protein [Phycicoccus endophyticus]NHI19755.1 sulfate permease [Phycicoccus endophyticus]QNN49615.1 DUF308 domain-containing protein [Phycicoccus endophyticus]GGL33345.1 hypothetical protein GCM10012283_14730 [Phycicoccus endophyticus]